MTERAPLRSTQLADKSALVVGLGGLGCPAALALAQAGVGRLVLVDDDIVDVTNLHRQILYRDADVGRHKLEVARERLLEEGVPIVQIEKTRFLPENARSLARRVDVVIEGADNFATKFLAADACFLENKPVVHGAAVRFVGTVLSVGTHARPCYRCLFEDVLPDDAAPNCNEAGVLGPVVGFVGALLADRALDLLAGDEGRTGELVSYDGKRDHLRAVRVHPRAACPLCGENPLLREIEEFRYFNPTCAA